MGMNGMVFMSKRLASRPVLRRSLLCFLVCVSMADLFPASAAAASDGTTVSGKPKRTSLMNQDTVAAKFLDPYAVSPLAGVEHKTLWRLVLGGDKWAEFWCELAADKEQGGDYLHGVFLSRLVEVPLNAGTEMSTFFDLGAAGYIAMCLQCAGIGSDCLCNHGVCFRCCAVRSHFLYLGASIRAVVRLASINGMIQCPDAGEHDMCSRSCVSAAVDITVLM